MARGVLVKPNWSVATRPPTPITGTFLTSKPFILRRLGLLVRVWARPASPAPTPVGVPVPIRAFTAARPEFPMALKILLNEPALSLFTRASERKLKLRNIIIKSMFRNQKPLKPSPFITNVFHFLDLQFEILKNFCKY